MSEGLEIVFHGAAGTVTGSCTELSCNGRKLLVDCGLFQGSRSLERLNFDPFRFRPEAVEGLLLTHAHIDHSGLLPRLAGKGFCGPVWCTTPTRDLLVYMLADSARLQENEAAQRNRRRDRADEPSVEPLYTAEDVELALSLVRPTPLSEWFEPAPGFRARFWNAGHILGSASIEVEAGGVSLLFSGDLGPSEKRLQPPSQAPSGLDYVLCESTYGDRDREDMGAEDRRSLLAREVAAAFARGGNLIVPIFAVERAQELLVDLALLFDAGTLPVRPVFIDSPLATRITSVFAGGHLPGTGDGDIFRHRAFHYVDSTAESIRLNHVSGAVILAGSGMCEGGRVRHHLIHNLGRADSSVLFVGYQAKGTLGRSIVDGAKRVRISGHDVAVRAHIARIDSYSAHADRQDILAWIAQRKPIAGGLFLNHGEASAFESLRQALEPEQRVIVPAIGERYRLRAGQPAERLATGDPAILEVLGEDWQNDYAAFAVNLKRDLQRIRDDAARREALRRMRAVLDDYAEHRRQTRGGRSEEKRHHDRGQRRARS